MSHATETLTTTIPTVPTAVDDANVEKTDDVTEDNENIIVDTLYATNDDNDDAKVKQGMKTKMRKMMILQLHQRMRKTI